MRADAILFDKDGTLFDFAGTWNGWAGGVIESFAEGDEVLAARIAAALDYDLGARSFLPESAVIAGTNREAAEAVAAVLPGRDVEWIEDFMMRQAAEASPAPATDLVPLLTGLAGGGLRLGVMTNDTEYAARAHLVAAGIEGHFDFIAGFDSGHGAKPDAAPLLAFAAAMGLAPGRVVMVGDSLHDLVAGRAAGMQTVAVLTGMAPASELSPMADVVLPHIGHIPGWLRESVVPA
ncbi:phosphoglycolate phosphatase [Salinihabitans flavidus]|uniref:phosphoglycolate phosphatase n=1 Tax=Salinihabitans flavidus TaxID=569882 RepID=A0A1H8TRQ8_9RHOB|nr:HAD-IA family hydrolase [Salinihabitans flavidus]SEO93304.1 phosphoglycolate phosphatase [Salinihabitans flavidus]